MFTIEWLHHGKIVAMAVSMKGDLQQAMMSARRQTPLIRDRNPMMPPEVVRLKNALGREISRETT
jgi:hypothetical protein